jgi:hypothetical protein
MAKKKSRKWLRKKLAKLDEKMDRLEYKAMGLSEKAGVRGHRMPQMEK